MKFNSKVKELNDLGFKKLARTLNFNDTNKYKDMKISLKDYKELVQNLLCLNIKNIVWRNNLVDLRTRLSEKFKDHPINDIFDNNKEYFNTKHELLCKFDDDADFKKEVRRLHNDYKKNYRIDYGNIKNGKLEKKYDEGKVKTEFIELHNILLNNNKKTDDTKITDNTEISGKVLLDYKLSLIDELIAFMKEQKRSGKKYNKYTVNKPFE